MARNPKKPKLNLTLKKLEDQSEEAMQADPVGVIQDLFGSILWEDQRRIIESVRDHPRTAWRSCHGIGKSFACARLVIWWLYSFPYSIVLTTAPTWRQVSDILWKEIRSCYNNSKIPLGGNLRPSSTELSIDGKEWIAIGLSTNESNRFQGYHAEHLLVVVDEASGVAEDIFEAIEGVLTSAHCRLALIGNPTDIGGKFYEAFRKEGWHTGKTAAWDTPNFTSAGITREDVISGVWKEKAPKNADGSYTWPMPWLITPEWAANALTEWGAHHPAWSARVEGDFPEQGEYNVIPLSWIEQAQDRWQDIIPTGQSILGVDVARGGMDKSAIAVRRDNKIEYVKTYSGLDTQQLAGEVIRVYRVENARWVNVDVIGLGAGVVDELKNHRDIKCNEVNVATKSEILDKQGNRVYANLRAELWWALREALDPKGSILLGLPPRASGVLADLAAPLYDFRRGYIQIEDKEETKKRLGRSPDEGDAVMLTFAPLTKRSPSKVGLIQPAPSKMITPAYRIPGAGIPSRQIG